jgi:uncharacterized protein (DUF1501 family)
MTIDRRSILRGTAAGLAALTTTSLPRFARLAQAASVARYAGHRSLVAVFLLGGNDGNQLVVPRDTRYDLYALKRQTIKLAKGDLRPIPTGTQTETNATFGLHPAMIKVTEAFAANQAAVVFNVGPAALPTTKADYLDTAFRKPANLFSHSDQQDAWSTAVPVPSLDPAHARTGWGGRTADAVEPLNPLVAGTTYPAMTLVGGRRSFAAGIGMPLVTNSSGDLSFKPDSTNPYYVLRRQRLAEVAGHDAGNQLAAGYGEILATSTAIAVERTRARAEAWARLAATTQTAINGRFAAAQEGWSLPAQLLTVLKDIVAAAIAPTHGLGLRRQVFSVGLGGFDTHGDQRAIQDALFAQLDFALDAFHRSMADLALDPVFGGVPPQSTLFTMSDFGRTLSENSDGGTDHAWGNHMLVMGSQVSGRRVLGTFPDLDLATSVDTTDGRGRWIPTTTVDQYVYNLGAWLGCNSTELGEILPNHAAYRADATARALGTAYTRLQHAIMLAD